MKDLTLIECQSIIGGDRASYFGAYYFGKVLKCLSDFYDVALKPDPNMGIPFAA